MANKFCITNKIKDVSYKKKKKSYGYDDSWCVKKKKCFVVFLFLESHFEM